MNFKNILALFGVMLFGAGLVMAISGAGVAVVSDTRWTGNTSAFDVTEGGNITALNVNGTVLTDKWAAYYGNVSGEIALTDGTFNVYSWTWTPAAGGEVCMVSTGTSFDWTASEITTAAEIDTTWSFSTAADVDQAVDTFTAATCDLTFAQATVTDTINFDTGGAFTTCAIDDGANAAVSDYAFCSVVQSAGVAYDGSTANYEVMVPTSTGTGTETYYFYVELD